ncbi:MAG: hypothetical protein Q4C53_00665 [Clostridia bacterium]|nr:hypothetical protein [Clostridia bacterium]
MKKILVFVLALALCLSCAAALAEEGVAYGVYSMEGEHPDSLIRATVMTEDGKVVSCAFDEKLIPVAVGGASGWNELDAETAAKLNGAVVVSGDKTYAAAFKLGDIVWTVDAELNVTNPEKGEFMAYVTTPEGGAWYFAQESADLLGADGNVAVTVPVGTKESINHGVGFWPSELKFPGNIAALENFVVANGTEYAQEDIKMGENGWQVADAVTGATLAGTPNYLLLAKEAGASAK